MNRILLSILIFIFFIPIIGCADVIYDESINGPLSGDDKNPTSLGTLSLGMSTVEGSVSNSETSSGGSISSDNFTFAVPTGDIITGVDITMQDQIDQLLFIGNPDNQLDGSSTTSATNGNVLLQLNLGPLSAGTYLLGLYDYDLSKNSNSVLLSNPSGYMNENAYSITFNEIAVPEPSTSSLFLTAVMLIFGFKFLRSALATRKKNT